MVVDGQGHSAVFQKKKKSEQKYHVVSDPTAYSLSVQCRCIGQEETNSCFVNTHMVVRPSATNLNT